MRLFKIKKKKPKTAKHSDITIDLYTTKLSVASEVHHLLVISDVDLSSLKVMQLC